MKVIFSDCFDTLIVRDEHPHQIIRRWAECVSRLYPSVDSSILFEYRIKSSKELSVEKNGIYCLFEQIADKFLNIEKEKNRNTFLSDLINLELACEASSSRINQKVCLFLKKQKERGATIYCITDYHLSSEHIKQLLLELGVNFLDGIYSSANYGKTKRSGELYNVVISDLSLQKKDCLMIGDNRIVDIKNARKNGLKAKCFSNAIHKTIIRLNNKLNYTNYSIRKIGKKFLKQDNTYAEFVLVFYTFCARLYAELKMRQADKVVFLAREGLFLKKCFEIYQELCIPKDNRLLTDYLKCSRRAIHSVQMDKCKPVFFGDISPLNYFTSIGFSEQEGLELLEQIGIKDVKNVINDFSHSQVSKVIWEKLGTAIENRVRDNQNAFNEYVHSISNGERLFLVDVGWIGRMQQGIDVLFDDIETCGYYIGVYQNLFEQPFVERHGLVFNKEENGNTSMFFNIFRSNIQLYEQLLSAPHGSACFYYFENGKPSVFEKWDENEKHLYETVVENVQEKMLLLFRRVCTYHFEDVLKSCYLRNRYNNDLALTILRSCLLQTKSRMAFMESLIDGFSQNFQQQSKGMQFSKNDIEVKRIDMLIHPDRFVRYFCKLGVVMDKKGMGWLGRTLMKLYYCWCRLLIRF